MLAQIDDAQERIRALGTGGPIGRALDEQFFDAARTQLAQLGAPARGSRLRAAFMSFGPSHPCRSLSRRDGFPHPHTLTGARRKDAM